MNMGLKGIVTGALLLAASGAGATVFEASRTAAELAKMSHEAAAAARMQGLESSADIFSGQMDGGDVSAVTLGDPDAAGAVALGGLWPSVETRSLRSVPAAVASPMVASKASLAGSRHSRGARSDPAIPLMGMGFGAAAGLLFGSAMGGLAGGIIGAVIVAACIALICGIF